MRSIRGNAESLDRGNVVADVSDESIFKIMYLALRNAAKKWTMPIRDWGAARGNVVSETSSPSSSVMSGCRSYKKEKLFTQNY
jgi:hypothetical protein